MNEKRMVGGEKSRQAEMGAAFQMTEAYKKMSVNLLAKLADTNRRTVIFSSAEPSVSKSALCANLAIVMAQTGARVLLVDGDMRRPVQHRHFRVEQTPGLSTLLTGKSTWEQVVRCQVKPYVDLIPAGETAANPVELLGADSMAALIRKWEKSYDLIFVDMPPLCVVADALVPASQTAGIVLAATYERTPCAALKEAAEMVRDAGVTLLGTVLADVPPEELGCTKNGKQPYFRSKKYIYALDEGSGC